MLGRMLGLGVSFWFSFWLFIGVSLKGSRSSLLPLFISNLSRFLLLLCFGSLLGFLWIPVGFHWIFSWFVLSDKVKIWLCMASIGQHVYFENGYPLSAQLRRHTSLPRWFQPDLWRRLPVYAVPSLRPYISGGHSAVLSTAHDS